MVFITGFIKAIKGKDLVVNIKSIINFISGHESLLNIRILYRNISISNIIFRENEDNSFLINTDLNIKTGSNRVSGAPGKTSIKIFIVISTLFSEPYSFIYNLESFF